MPVALVGDVGLTGCGAAESGGALPPFRGVPDAAGRSPRRRRAQQERAADVARRHGRTEHQPGMPFDVMHNVHRLLHRVHRVADGALDGLDGILDSFLNTVDGVGDGGGRPFDSADDSIFERLQLVGEGRAGSLHLLPDHFGCLIHCRFSFSASTDWSGSGLNDRKRWTPTAISAPPMTARTTPTVPALAHQDHKASSCSSATSMNTSGPTARAATATPAEMAVTASFVLRRSARISSRKSANCCCM